MKIVFDANIYFSAIGVDNETLKLVEYCFLQSEWIIFLSPSTKLEIQNKILSDKFQKATKSRIPKSEIEQIIQTLFANTIEIKPTKKVDICRDPKDNMFLELSETSQADFLVTGDKDLLVLKEFQNTKILTPRGFIEVLELKI
jgi:uncharacterized protein